jgi:hypothetical protein
MVVNGRDCLIVIKTQYREVGIPYSEETIREAVSLLMEEAPIEGDGSCRAIRKSGGVTGCVVTPLTIGTAPSCCIWQWGVRVCLCMYRRPGTFMYTG